MDDFDDFIAILKAGIHSNETDESYKRVKIGVLDTGIREDHRMVPKIIYHDFLDKSRTNPQDFTGHGTNSVELILKACVDAELFVGRIFGDDSSDETRGPKLMAKVAIPCHGNTSYRQLTSLISPCRKLIGLEKKRLILSVSLRDSSARD